LSKNMADQRKSFRARRLAFGGRTLLCLLAATVLASAAQAQEAGLKNGAASLAAGKYSDAVRQLSATINSENATPGDAAKALYLRGIAYRKMGEPARAAADLGAAVWLGLPEPDRVKALVNRGLAYRSAGLSKEAEAELASARTIGGSSEVDKLVAEGGGSTESAASVTARSTEARPGDQASASNEGSSWFSLSRFRNRGGTPAPAPQPEAAPTRTASASPQWSTTTTKPGETEAPGAWSTSVASADQPSNASSASSGGNRFTRWFGSGSDSSPAPQAAPQPAPAPQPATATQTAAATPQPSKPPAAAASSNWSTTTENASADAGGGEKKSSWRIFGRSAEAEPAAEPAAPTSSSGGYQLQLANSRSEGEANALWKKISQSQGLSGVSHEIEKIEIGNFGTFYSLKIGPFPDKAQSVKVCNALKRNGIDCLPATL
jgi:tetratricopeptide (TPR) repeat protein